MSAPLTIYKASAGSGKTFTLAIEYISLLIRNPKSYEQILAVTFTNKATEEMKMRIVSQLYGISLRLPDSESYLKAVMERTGKPETEVVERAGIALHLLIHNYNHFRVQTIDAFFQSVLRNLARELELTANLKVDLNDNMVEEQAVDELIESLDSDARVLHWIHDYIDKNIKDDLSWNVIGDIKKFGMNIFRDFYKVHADELDKLMKNEKFFESYTKQLRQRRDSIQGSLRKAAKEMLEVLLQHGFDDSSYYKYGDKGTVWKFIHSQAVQKKVDNSPTPPRVLQYLEDPASMMGKAADSQTFISFAQTTLIPLLKQYEEKRKKGWKEYQSAVLTLRHMNQLRLLHAIAEAVDDINREANRFQLSNTQSLLNSLINDSDSPFIFEKIGAMLKHIMIDEFQDTSRIQWENFKVLLSNCLAQHDSHNLIVGDVKQSIYRWRSGDWRLLNDMDREFASELMKEQPLKTNFRSEEKIVKFNNAFFEEAVRVTVQELKDDNIDGYEQLAKAYKTDELKQNVFKSNGNGLVHIELLPNTDYRQTIMDKLVDAVDNLLEQGTAPEDIAILVRANNDIRDIAAHFIQVWPQLKLVSDEAFRLDASLSVNILIAALRLISHPEDKLVKAQLVKDYQQQVLGNKITDAELFIGTNLDSLLPEGFSCTDLQTMPVMDLIDHLYRLFELHRITNQSAYVCAFYDVLATFLHDNVASIEHFLNEWDENLYKKTIQSDESDGIRIISIHKSKGLEFPHVIIPLCDWQLERSDTIWCEKKTEDPYDKLPIIPIDFSKTGMMGTVYEKDYTEEHLQNVVDNMNLLYVAFTRAGKSLFVTGKRMSKKRKDDKKKTVTSANRSEVIEDCLPKLAETFLDSFLTGADDEKEPLVFEWGVLPEIETKKEKKTENVFLTPYEEHMVNIETFKTTVGFRQSNKSREFVKGDDEEQTSSISYIKLGNVLHALFSTIETTDDIEPRLRELELDGVIYDDEIIADEIRTKLQKALQNEQVKEWFAPHWRVYNECTILTKSDDGIPPQESRPDRVIVDGDRMIVIDFKFGAPRPEYHEQVRRYMNLLSTMGYTHIEGYLWYVLRNKIESVTPQKEEE